MNSRFLAVLAAAAILPVAAQTAVSPGAALPQAKVEVVEDKADGKAKPGMQPAKASRKPSKKMAKKKKQAPKKAAS